MSTALALAMELAVLRVPRVLEGSECSGLCSGRCPCPCPCPCPCAPSPRPRLWPSGPCAPCCPLAARRVVSGADCWGDCWACARRHARRAGARAREQVALMLQRADTEEEEVEVDVPASPSSVTCIRPFVN